VHAFVRQLIATLFIEVAELINQVALKTALQ
jgi:hypothetical protein